MLVSLPPVWETRWNFWFLDSASPRPSYCIHVMSEPTDVIYPCVSLSFCLSAFEISKLRGQGCSSDSEKTYKDRVVRMEVKVWMRGDALEQEWLSNWRIHLLPTATKHKVYNSHSTWGFDVPSSQNANKKYLPPRGRDCRWPGVDSLVGKNPMALAGQAEGSSPWRLQVETGINRHPGPGFTFAQMQMLNIL